MALLTSCGGERPALIPTQSHTVSARTATVGGHPTAAELGLWPRPGPAVRVCPDERAGYFTCDALIRTDVHGLGPDDVPKGYAPADLQKAYGLTEAAKTGGAFDQIAVVIPYDDPNAEADLAVYRKEWGLPECSTANHCFKKNKPEGTASSVAWAAEASLDLDMVSAICPKCGIELVEAKDDKGTALIEADIGAVKEHYYVSNSFHTNEIAAFKKYDDDFAKKGHVVTATTGDKGYLATAPWPAVLPGVTAVGGTTLSYNAGKGEYTQTAWSGAGSGCSKIYDKPDYQAALKTDMGCDKRAVADISAVADPNTGVAIYDSFGTPPIKNGGKDHWYVAGGTSVASPIIAAYLSLTTANSKASRNNAYLYSQASTLTDVTSGSNGSCKGALCNAGCGWDGPTGIGTPKGGLAPKNDAERFSPHGGTAACYKVLYSFSGGADGNNPQAGVIALNGVFYGTTEYGGDAAITNSGAGGGTVYSLTPNSSATGYTKKTLHSFTGCTIASSSSGCSKHPNPTDGAYPFGGLVALNGMLYGTTFAGGTLCERQLTPQPGCGTVYAISPSGSESVLYSFGNTCPGKTTSDCPDGVSPYGDLVALNGTLYGTTSYGGTAQCPGTVSSAHVTGCNGTVYSITPSGSEHVIYSFQGGADGLGPQAGLVAYNGVLYGTTYQGGSGKCAGGCGTIFSVTTGGSERVLHSFGGGTDGSAPLGNLVVSNGVLYGTTSGLIGSSSGIADDSTIFTIGTNGNGYKVLYSLGGGGSIAGLTLIDNGPLGQLFYGTTNETLFAVDSGFNDYAALHQFAATTSDGATPIGTLLELNGALYGATEYAGTGGGGTVFELQTPYCGSQCIVEP